MPSDVVIPHSWNHFTTFLLELSVWAFRMNEKASRRCEDPLRYHLTQDTHVHISTQTELSTVFRTSDVCLILMALRLHLTLCQPTSTSAYTLILTLTHTAEQTAVQDKCLIRQIPMEPINREVTTHWDVRDCSGTDREWYHLMSYFHDMKMDKNKCWGIWLRQKERR